MLRQSAMGGGRSQGAYGTGVSVPSLCLSSSERLPLKFQATDAISTFPCNDLNQSPLVKTLA